MTGWVRWLQSTIQTAVFFLLVVKEPENHQVIRGGQTCLCLISLSIHQSKSSSNPPQQNEPQVSRYIALATISDPSFLLAKHGKCKPKFQNCKHLFCHTDKEELQVPEDW